MNTPDDLRHIATLTNPDTRAKAIAHFTADRVSLFDRIAASLCRRYGLARTEHAGDIASIVAAQCLTLVAQVTTTPDKADTVINFEGLLYASCAPLVRSYAHSELGRAPATGMQTIMRRRAALLALQDELCTTWGREPTCDELLTEFNRRAQHTRDNAAAQGALATQADLVCLSYAPEPTEADLVSDEPDYILYPHEGRAVVEHTLTAARNTGNETLLEVAKLWFADYLTPDGGDLATSTQIASTLGLPDRKVRHLIAQVRALAAQVLHDRYGIGPDHAAAA